MAEVIGTIAAVAGLLEQSIQLFSRLHDAAERQKDMPELIQKYSAEVSQTQSIVVLVKKEDGLKTPSVGSSIAKLGRVAESLKNHLAKMAATKGRIRGFFHQLTSGKKAEEVLKGIMKDLGNAKVDLSIYIQLSNVGLTRGVGEAMHVSIAAVEAMNKLLREKLGSGHVLKISELLDGKPHNDDGTVTLSKEDISRLSEQETLAASKESGSSGDKKSQLIIEDNKAFLHALQVNTPIGVDVWKDMDIIIKRNTASTGAVQLNAPMATEDFRATLDAWGKE